MEDIFFVFLHQNMSYHRNCTSKAIPMSTHQIIFGTKIKKKKKKCKLIIQTDHLSGPEHWIFYLFIYHHFLLFECCIDPDKTGYPINFLLFLHRIKCCGFICRYSLQAPHQGTSNEYPHMFSWRKKKNIKLILSGAMKLFTVPCRFSWHEHQTDCPQTL